MALNIRNPEAERRAVEIARLTGENKTQAVIAALRARIESVRNRLKPRRLVDELEAVVGLSSR